MQIVILAGGLSSRMGRDKARLRLGTRTLLGHIRAAAVATGLPVRVIRRDAIPRCGPLGGVYTAMKKTRAEALLFLACDMPLLSPSLLNKIVRSFETQKRPLFTVTDSAGFPFILPRAALAVVEEQIAAKTFSLHVLAKRLKADTFTPSRRELSLLLNANTPADWEKLESRMRRTGTRAKKKTGSEKPI